MASKVLFLAHAPDAQPHEHRCLIQTSKYGLFVALVKDQDGAVEISIRSVKEESIHSIFLCPGFTHRDVGETAGAIGENAAVAVARGDGPRNRVWTEVRKREGWFSERGKG